MRERKNGDPTNGVEEWSSFGKRFENVGFSTKYLKRIKIAYKWAVDIHHNQTRKDHKTPFVTHPIAAAMIYFEELGGRNPDFIIALLMHDAVEMSRFWGNFDRLPYSEWVSDARERLTPNFGRKATDLIIALTKPVVDGVEIKSKEEAEARYFENLSSVEAIYMKMFDRLHNVRDFKYLSREEKENLIKETEELYIPKFEKAIAKYPEQATYLLSKMKSGLNDIRDSFDDPQVPFQPRLIPL